jgi:hypothetical protein
MDTNPQDLSQNATGDEERTESLSRAQEVVSLSLGVTTTREYLDLCADIVSNDAGACGQDDADVTSRSRAWATYLAPRVPFAVLAATYFQVRGDRADRFAVTPQEIAERYNVNSRAAGSRSGERCDYCKGGRVTVFNLALRDNVERWCPKCQMERAAQEPRLPSLRLADINPTVRQLTARDEMHSPTFATKYLEAILDAVGEYPSEEGRYDFEGLLETGLCPSCRNTGLEMTRRSGSWGLSTVSGSTDRSGHRTRNFVPCSCPLGEKRGGGERQMMPGAGQESLVPEWSR